MTLKHILSGFGCVALLSLPSLANAQTLSAADKAFMKLAAEANMTEAHVGQLAETQASQSQFREFGQKLTHDHTDAYQQLAELATKTHDSVPTGIDIRKMAAVEQLMKLKGAQFDRQFAQDEIRDHQKALDEFRREAQHGKDPDVKGYASKLIPVIEDHLHEAQALAKTTKQRHAA
jgi:putative membrane protein